jgi:O-antigen/teichoic acid export membrane protein
MLHKILNKLNQNMLLSVAHQLLTAVYGFGLLFILYRVAGKREIGRWILISSAFSLMDMVMHGFLQIPVVRKLSIEGPGKKSINAIASNALVFAICIWLIGSILIFAASFVFKSQFVFDLRWYALMGLAMAFYNVCWWIGIGCSNFKAILVQRFIFITVSASVIAFFVYTRGSLGISGIILSQASGYMVSATLAFLLVSKIKISFKPVHRSYLHFFFSYGKFTFGSMIMGSLLRNADIFMIGGFLGQAAVAVYGAAQKMVEIFEVALRGIAMHSLPEFCRLAGDPKMLIKKYMRLSALIFLAFLPLAFCMFVFSGQVIRLFSGSADYNAASLILKVFMVYVLFLIVDRMTGVTLEAMGLARYNLIKTFLLVIVNVAGNAVALYFFNSLAGVAFVSILAAITGIILGWYFLLLNSGLMFNKENIRAGLNLIRR